MEDAKIRKQSDHLDNAWAYKQHMRLMVKELTSGKSQMTNQWIENFLALGELRKDEIQAAQKLAEN